VKTNQRLSGRFQVNAHGLVGNSIVIRPESEIPSGATQSRGTGPGSWEVSPVDSESLPGID
jgi:hypothetical protein